MPAFHNLCIIGAGGFGSEVLCLALDILRAEGRSESHASITLAVEDAFWQPKHILGQPVQPLSALDLRQYEVVVAISDPKARERVVAGLPDDTRFATLIHPSVIMSDWVETGPGSIICAGSILTCNIRLGAHTQLNLQTTVGHDVVAGDFVTTAPGARISGNCRIGKGVYIGTNACLRQKLQLADYATIGMGAVVLQDIPDDGVYTGIPARRQKA